MAEASKARRAWTIDGVAVAALVAAGATIAWFGRDWFFLHDEWGFIFYRRAGGITAFLAPIHGHLFAGVLVIYRVLFSTVGLRHYGAYRGVEIALHLLCAGLLYVYARRRGLQPLIAWLVLVLLAFLGTAWEVLFWLASAGFIIPVIVLLAVLVLWDSEVPAVNLLTALLAVIALGTYGLGVAVVAGLMVAAMGPGRSWQRLTALGVPLAGWGIWFVAIRPSLNSPASLRRIPGASRTGDIGSLGNPTSHILGLPAWLAHSAAGALAALVGHPELTEIGFVLGLALAAGAVWQWKNGALDRWRFCGIAVAAVVFWVLTGLARAQTSSPAASRYLYPGIAFVLILAVECLRGVRLPTSLLAGLAVLVALSVWANVSVLQSEQRATSAVFAREKVALAQLESCRGRLPRSFKPGNTAQGVIAGPFWAATAALGDPVPPVPVADDPMCPSPPTG